MSNKSEQWIPIDEFPYSKLDYNQDNDYLVCNVKTGERCIARVCDFSFEIAWIYDSSGFRITPTHYMEIPKLPVQRSNYVKKHPKKNSVLALT